MVHDPTLSYKGREKNSKANIFFLRILSFKTLETLKKCFISLKSFSGVISAVVVFFSLYDFGYRVNTFSALGKLLSCPLSLDTSSTWQQGVTAAVLSKPKSLWHSRQTRMKNDMKTYIVLMISNRFVIGCHDFVQLLW